MLEPDEQRGKRLALSEALTQDDKDKIKMQVVET